jgi:Fe-S-cluster containining protein
MDNNLQYIAEHLDSMTIGVDEPFKFHCDMCGKCCINREDILLNAKDIYNMSKELQMEPVDMFKKYCETYIGESSRIPIVRIKPRGSIKRCPLMKEHKCSVHKAKPTVCAMFPIGRCIKMDASNQNVEINTSDIRYIFTDPGCGDNSETHTVREWLGEFGIPLEDEFFLAWNRMISELGAIFHKGEKVLSEEGMMAAWNLTFVKIYLDYDMTKEFLPQFKENAEEILAVMRTMPTKKDKKKGGK